MKNPKITICGNYGATNIGDEMILRGIVSTIRSIKQDAEITVLSHNPEETSKRYEVNSCYFLPFGP